MITDLPEEIDDTVVGLFRLSEWILSLLQDGGYGRVQTVALVKIYAKLADSLDLLNSYEQASEGGEEDLAHLYGFSYSELMADVNDLMLELQEDGITIRLQ